MLQTVGMVRSRGEESRSEGSWWMGGFYRWRGTQSRQKERLDQESNVFRQLQVSESSAMDRRGRRVVWIMRS